MNRVDPFKPTIDPSHLNEISIDGHEIYELTLCFNGKSKSFVFDKGAGIVKACESIAKQAEQWVREKTLKMEIRRHE